MIVGVVKESLSGERRVALVPAVIRLLEKAGHQVVIEPGAGAEAGFSDDQYLKKNASLGGDRRAVFSAADVICQVRTLGANPKAGQSDLLLMRTGQAIVGLAEPLTDIRPTQAMAQRGVHLFALELLPRITRAQSMDVLSSQATVAGYKAVLLAAAHSPRMFPMMMTAAGTVAAARVLIIGAGVAGLQAIATARKLGGVVQSYDIRPAVRQEVESLGAKFLQIELDTQNSEDKGGYAKAMDDSFYRRQQELMAHAVAVSDVVITTAAVPGKRSPVLVTEVMVQRMPPGGVIVDLAAERGGNCELTRADETVHAHGVTILGPTNLPATTPQTASQMFARNMVSFILHLSAEGRLRLDMKDEIISSTLLTSDGQIVNSRLRLAMGLPDPAAEPSSTSALAEPT